MGGSYNCEFHEIVDFKEGDWGGFVTVFDTTAQCPMCGAYRKLYPASRESEMYLFPTHRFLKRKRPVISAWRMIDEKWSYTLGNERGPQDL